jgi:hypothetical protein
MLHLRSTFNRRGDTHGFCGLLQAGCIRTSHLAMLQIAFASLINDRDVGVDVAVDSARSVEIARRLLIIPL